MPSELRVRPFVPNDQEATRQLVLAGLAEHWGELDPKLNQDLDDILASYGHGQTLTVELEHGLLVGTGTVIPWDSATAEIVRMSVDSRLRRQNIGSTIVSALLDTARSWGSSRIVLETSSGWTDVVAFYISCGFRITHQADGPFGSDTWFELSL